MQQMLEQAQRLQQQVLQAQEQLARTHVEGNAGGLVAATVTGDGQLVGLTIAREAVDPDDTETLADLVLAAVRDANEKAQQLQSTTMGPLTQGLGGLGQGLGLPGM
jgi:DNA-binding YbaB/EbfC family protein